MMKFYICKHCGNVITKLTSSQVPVQCCGERVQALEAEHLIQWVAVVTDRDALIHWFHPEEAPEAVFALAEGQQVKEVYAYCNLHGLWKAEL